MHKIFIIFSLLLFISSCTHVKKDGPPSFHVDVNKIPNAKPKIEPLSKLGNKPYYTALGKTYKIWTGRKNYIDRGMASWYGTKFHLRRTSSGERYNMLSMTAAHRFLPLPTYVQVTNLENGRKVIVKVNDRGPFAANRIIDLSYVAAKKLDMLSKGTAFVEVRAINPGLPKPKVTHPKKCRNCKIIVQKNRAVLHYLKLGKFNNSKHAHIRKSQISKLLTERIMVKSLYKDARLYYQVQIGPIRDKITAEKIKKILEKKGFTPELYAI